ncbi:family transcriptional regulator [Leptolyngbya sp. Heron Island J]|uniref:helix-turn-helix domain-containing protein n=1 Tax=Leptolyngbya sp. Heron Island J TaxID=1385935 RepID=UPI0003B9DBBF|nr:AraC family transcriptional regulator [Leptolyngbya sp. Heron Island J]ESA37965.1 family transcriptional regulator [Leptolyngbya sp. Heron Island J]
MAATIKVYNSMSEFYASMGGALEQDVDFTIHRLEDIHGDVPVKSPVFRANYYSVLIIRAGRGRYIIDDQSYPTRNGTIYFTNPGHIKGFEIYERSYGYVITFSEAFLKQYVRETVLDDFPFLIAEVAPPSYPEADTVQIFDRLGEQLLGEYQSKSDYKFQIIGCLVVVLLLKIKERFWKAYNPLTEVSTSSTIAITFKRHLEAHFRDLLAGQCDRLFQVQDYAQAQYLNPNYFSSVIKLKTGKTVNNWITEKIVAEAKSLLRRSSEPIQEVASLLGFKNAAHFSRFFKKHAEVSPSVFRKSFQQEG